MRLERIHVTPVISLWQQTYFLVSFKHFETTVDATALILSKKAQQQNQ